ncbi:MAG: DUF177 domain-containing protein [Cyclobacteriaceae bacterium]|jgi:uncharacterized protein|nr:DUF177 domain-containing protein [Cyclobacteriaceae bacterium]
MDKKGERVYNIDLYGLRFGTHDFEFSFDSQLFDKQELMIVEKGQGSCNVTLEKSELLISLQFEIKGEVELTCDRSMENFLFPLELKERLILKYGEELDDTRDDVWIIPEGLQVFNVKNNILEFINVAIPMKRLHPRFGEDDAEGLELVYSTENLSEDNNSEEEIDPRWSALKELKNSKN